LSPKVAATPKEQGFSMPAEWAPHEAIWLSWPHDRDSFPELEVVEKTYCDIIAGISVSEEVRLFVHPGEMQARAEGLLRRASVDLSRVKFYGGRHADVWFRDYGPIFITHPQRGIAMTHWIFNAWGEKYPELLGDTDIPKTILEKHPMPCFRPGLVMEGGSIDVNGAGSLLTTEQCLLNKNRNPELSREQIEKALDDNLNTPNVIWLGEGVAGDDTDGHIDDIARFVSERAVLIAVEEDPADSNYERLRDNVKRLQSAKDVAGRPFEIIEVPMPTPGFRADGSHLPASYTNFYIGNTVVLAPVFSSKQDARAMAAISKAFPRHTVRPLECTQLVHGNGTLHCISQQQPRAQ
jgi:agmatine deiminase